mmetsp:Transcript_32333/g.39736  ORF Transcript_32333/g.39736 Transcript_32333/m.39736 type:complete len:145 (+) Transcript_32333:111-545(+)
MIYFVAVLLTNIMMCALAIKTSRTTVREMLGHEVAPLEGGGACYHWKIYDDGNSDCLGEASAEGGYTVGISVQDGCYNDGYGNSYSVFCDDAGYHFVYFKSMTDCTGNGYEQISMPNGCYAYGYAFGSCTTDGPCDGGAAKSIV